MKGQFNIGKQIVYGLVAGCAIVSASGAHAQAVEAKKEESSSILPKVTPTLQLRHYYSTLKDESAQNGSTKILNQEEGRLYLTATVFDKVDLTALFRVGKKPYSDAVTQKGGEYEADLNLIANDYFNLVPKVQVFPPVNGDNNSVTTVAPGLFVKGSMPLQLTGGQGEIYAQAEGDFLMNSRQSDQTVEHEPSVNAKAGLTESAQADSTNPNAATAMTYLGIYDVGATLPITAELKLDLMEELCQAYEPRYVQQSATGDVDTSYPVKTETTENIKLAYKLTDHLSVINSMIIAHDGVLRQRVANGGTGESSNGNLNASGLGAFTNIAYISYKM